jgi:hypothetical protein
LELPGQDRCTHRIRDLLIRRSRVVRDLPQATAIVTSSELNVITTRSSPPKVVGKKQLSAARVRLLGMDESALVVAKVPGANLRVSRADFAAVWAAVEGWGGRPGPNNDYLLGVLLTCEWLAAQPVWSSVIGRAEMPAAPYTGRRHSAMPETIEAEYVAALGALRRGHGRAELARGAAATLAWAWYGSTQVPADVADSLGG